MLVFLLSFSLFAAIEDVSISGSYSYFDFDENETNYVIYAGFVDSGTCGSTIDVCNTCDDPTGIWSSGDLSKACSARAVEVDAELKISLRSTNTTQTESRPYILTTDDDDSDLITGCESSFAGPGSSETITCSWSNICSEGFGSACNAITELRSETFRLGKDIGGSSPNDELDDEDDYIEIDIAIGYVNNYSTELSSTGNSNAISAYSLIPGDQKVFLDSYTTAFSSITRTGEIKYKAARVYYEEFQDGDPNKPATDYPCGDTTKALFDHESPFQDINFSSTTNVLIGNQAVTNLENDKSYCFRLAIVDDLGFVSALSSATSGDADYDNYKFSKTQPSEVAGLIDEGNCFVVTAAYGSPLDARLDIFRTFRDQILNRFSLGKKIVAFYYEHSRPLAIWIAQHTIAKKTAELLLYPLLAFAFLATQPWYLLLLLPLVAMLFRKRISRWFSY
tara:strand:- start:5361 stop:6710 length:1350 start_codon:yes stop_codon:yes gene_type:complete